MNCGLPGLFQAVLAHAQHVAADDFSNFLILIAALHKADGKEWPVGPSDGQARLWLRTQAAHRPKITPCGTSSRNLGNLGRLSGLITGPVGDIRADAHMVDAGGLDDVVDVVKERVDISGVTEETRYACDAGESAGVGNGLEHGVRLTSDVLVQIRGATVTG